jgi:hypothetical protein
MNQNNSEMVLYKAKDGTVRLDVQLKRETIWLDAHQMAELFARDRTVVLRHIRNIYKTGELPRESTSAKIAQVAADGKIRQMDIFNLDVIISVGYRVNSRRGTEFRIWATNILKRHLVQGYTVNEKRLKELKQTLYKRIADNALVAMTLMIAESRPQEKEIIAAMLTNLMGCGQ